jgi:hypothetical protein
MSKRENLVGAVEKRISGNHIQRVAPQVKQNHQRQKRWRRRKQARKELAGSQRGNHNGKIWKRFYALQWLPD